jgi:hypothetical protein
MDKKDNIQIKIQGIVSQIEKDYEKKIDDAKKLERSNILDKLFNMFPYLEKEKDNILTECSKKNISDDNKFNEIKIDQKKKNDIVLEQYIHTYQNSEKKYYVNTKGSAFDVNFDLIGAVSKYNDNGIPLKIIFFDKKMDINTNIKSKYGSFNQKNNTIQHDILRQNNQLDANNLNINVEYNDVTNNLVKDVLQPIDVNNKCVE